MNLHNLLHLLQNAGSDGKLLLPFVMKFAPDEATRNAYRGFVIGNEKMIGSFLTMAINSLRTLSNNEIAAMMSVDELDFDSLRKRKTVVYVMTPEEDAEYYEFITNMFMNQLFAAQKKLEYKTRGLPLYILYDEFGNSFVPHFSSLATTLRKYRVSLSIILQDFAQLENKYGKEDSRTIVAGAMRNKLFYSGLDLAVSQELESMLGKVKVTKKSKGMKTVREENLLNADRIRRINANQAIYLSSNQEPVMLKTTPCFENSSFRAHLSLPPHPLTAATGRRVEYLDIAEIVFNSP